MEYTEEQYYNIANNMEDYGGSFVNRLGVLLRYADPLNKKKLADAFPEYFKQYLNF